MVPEAFARFLEVHDNAPVICYLGEEKEEL